MIDDIEEIDEREFDDIQADKRNKALIKAFNGLATALNNKDDKAVVVAFNNQADKMEKLVSAIQDIPKPEVKVDLNPKEFVTSVQKICEDIVASNNKVIEALENRLLPESFVLVKGWNGATESVKVNYKPANQIAIKK